MKLSFAVKMPPGKSELKKLNPSRTSLTKGDRLEGTVVDIKSSGKVLIDFGNFRAVAEIEFPVEKGETLNLTVFDTEKKLLLGVQDHDKQGISDSGKPMPQPEIIAVKTDQLIENSNTQQHDAVNNMMVHGGPKAVTCNMPVMEPHIKEPLKIIKDVIKLISTLESFRSNRQISTNKEISVEIQNLLETARSLIDNDRSVLPESGKTIRCKLKPALVLLSRLLRDSSLCTERIHYRDLKSMKQSVENFLSGISAQRSSSGEKSLQTPESYQVLTFVLPFEEDLEKGKLKIYYPAGKVRDANGQFRISLLLAMDRIGEVRVDFYCFKKNMEITFFVRNDEIKTFFQDHIENIRMPLKDKFNGLLINVSVSEEKIDAFDNEPSNPGGTGMVDLRI